MSLLWSAVTMVVALMLSSRGGQPLRLNVSPAETRTFLIWLSAARTLAALPIKCPPNVRKRTPRGIRPSAAWRRRQRHANTAARAPALSHPYFFFFFFSSCFSLPYLTFACFPSVPIFFPSFPVFLSLLPCPRNSAEPERTRREGDCVSGDLGRGGK